MPENEEEPDQRMRREGGKMLEWIRDKSQGRRVDCPICGDSTWSVGVVMELKQHHGDRASETTAVMPLMPVSCNNCAYTFFMNALMAGLVSRPETGEWL